MLKSISLRWFFGKSKKSKSQSEINWPLSMGVTQSFLFIRFVVSILLVICSQRSDFSKCNFFSGVIFAKSCVKVKLVYPIVFVLNIFPNSRLIQKRIHIWGMENSSGKWILVDIFFQNEGILVDISIGWILVEIFHEFSWTFLPTRIPLFWWIFVDIFGVNSSGQFFQCNNTCGQVRSG